jgi:hypothetical protein
MSKEKKFAGGNGGEKLVRGVIILLPSWEGIHLHLVGLHRQS